MHYRRYVRCSEAANLGCATTAFGAVRCCLCSVLIRSTLGQITGSLRDSFHEIGSIMLAPAEQYIAVPMWTLTLLEQFRLHSCQLIRRTFLLPPDPLAILLRLRSLLQF